MSRIEVPMPQMGESIAEGTVSKWLKAAGDAVERDEAILEISTDKVDAEIPSPSAGILAEIVVSEGETVEVGTVVAYIEEGGAASVAAPPSVEARAEPASDGASGPEPPAASRPEATPASDQVTDTAATGSKADESDEVACTTTSEERLRTRSTPVVRRIAQEAGVDISAVSGTGHQGRVTKQDILSFIERGGAAPSPAPAPQPGPPAPAPGSRGGSSYLRRLAAGPFRRGVLPLLPPLPATPGSASTTRSSIPPIRYGRGPGRNDGQDAAPHGGAHGPGAAHLSPCPPHPRD